MKNDYSDFISQVHLKQIRLIKSQEELLSTEIDKDEGTQLKISQEFPKDEIAINKDCVVSLPKYRLSLSNESKTYFQAEYLILLEFHIDDEEKFKEYYSDNEIKEFFLKEQIQRTLWPILRGFFMDGCNRHGVKATPLPYVL